MNILKGRSVWQNLLYVPRMILIPFILLALDIFTVFIVMMSPVLVSVGAIDPVTRSDLKEMLFDIVEYHKEFVAIAIFNKWS